MDRVDTGRSSSLPGPPNPKRRWTVQDDDHLRQNAGAFPIPDLAAQLNRSVSSIITRATHLRLSLKQRNPVPVFKTPLVKRQSHRDSYERNKASINERRVIRKRARREAAKRDPDAPVTLVLAGRHSINGIPYGPGPVTVSRDLSKTLFYFESQMIRGELKAVQPRAYLVVRTRQGLRRREVPYSQFNQAIERLMVSGEGVI